MTFLVNARGINMSWIPSYKKPAGGSSYVPCDWSTGTDEEIVEALEQHYAGNCDLHEYWSVGDERTVSLSAITGSPNVSENQSAQNIILVITEIGGKTLADGTTECCFQIDQKNSLTTEGYMNGGNNNVNGWSGSSRRTWCNDQYYNAFPSTLKSIFKQFINKSGQGSGSSSGTYDTTDYFALRAEIEITGSTNYSVSGEGTQIEWYKTSSNRIKTGNFFSNANEYWLRSPSNFDQRFNYISGSGTCTVYNGYASQQRGIAPFGVI